MLMNPCLLAIGTGMQAHSNNTMFVALTVKHVHVVQPETLTAGYNI